VESFDISWKYLNTATPSPHECSKFSPDVPSAQTINVNDLSNQLKINIENIRNIKIIKNKLVCN
jgi:hypothetical protein